MTPSHNGPREDQLIDRCEELWPRRSARLGFPLRMPRSSSCSPVAPGEASASMCAPRIRRASRLGSGPRTGRRSPPGEPRSSRPNAPRRSCSQGGMDLRRVRHLAGPGMASMWQTLLNLLTFHRDFASQAASGRLRPGSGRGMAAFWIDAMVTVLAAVPTAALACPRDGRGHRPPRWSDRDRGGAAAAYELSPRTASATSVGAPRYGASAPESTSRAVLSASRCSSAAAASRNNEGVDGAVTITDGREASVSRDSGVDHAAVAPSRRTGRPASPVHPRWPRRPASRFPAPAPPGSSTDRGGLPPGRRRKPAPRGGAPGRRRGSRRRGQKAEEGRLDQHGAGDQLRTAQKEVQGDHGADPGATGHRRLRRGRFEQRGGIPLCSSIVVR